jgi:hypothetical protein
MRPRMLLLFICLLGLSFTAGADGVPAPLSDMNVTTDTMSASVDAGAGETFACSNGADFFSCTDPAGFTCYGAGNCEDLGVPVPVVLTPGEFFVTADSDNADPTPEPGTLVLLASGLVILTGATFWKRT